MAVDFIKGLRAGGWMLALHCLYEDLGSGDEGYSNRVIAV
jgi:hypothetical protein